jgi:ABC-type glycerol-3-phosphate transport system substrate-binding protein
MNKKLLIALLLLLTLTLGFGQIVSAQSTTLKVWGFTWTADWLKTIVAGFQDAHPGVTVDVQSFECDDVCNPYKDTLTTTMSSGADVPDVVTLDPLWAGDLIRGGAMAALPGIDQELNPADYVAGGWDLCQSKGTQYGVPADLDFEIVFYRKDIWDPAIQAAGLSGFPANTDDYIKVAQAISTDDMKATILAQQDYYGFYQGFMTPYNARLTNLEGTEYTYNSPEAVDALTLYNDLANKYHVALLWNSSTEGDSDTAVSSGAVASTMNGSWYVSTLESILPDQKGLWAVAPMPFGPADRQYSVGVGGACFSIPTASANQDLARQFLIYMEQPQVMATYYTIVGGLPGLKTSWQYIDLEAVNDYLGVPLAKLVSEWSSTVRAMELPSAEVITNLSDAVYHVTAEGMSPQEALDQAVTASPPLSS